MDRNEINRVARILLPLYRASYNNPGNFDGGVINDIYENNGVLSGLDRFLISRRASLIILKEEQEKCGNYYNDIEVRFAFIKARIGVNIRFIRNVAEMCLRQY